ncbi:MAG: hypothetical protein D6800_03125 [Candidatus Zixiibacteriota bacterium]|nr:MAG: hypothetical protein D6800_03125 [candidate division Zixibacteria bacterium]
MLEQVLAREDLEQMLNFWEQVRRRPARQVRRDDLFVPLGEPAVAPLVSEREVLPSTQSVSEGTEFFDETTLREEAARKASEVLHVTPEVSFAESLPESESSVRLYGFSEAVVKVIGASGSVYGVEENNIYPLIGGAPAFQIMEVIESGPEKPVVWKWKAVVQNNRIVLSRS